MKMAYYFEGVPYDDKVYYLFIYKEQYEQYLALWYTSSINKYATYQKLKARLRV